MNKTVWLRTLMIFALTSVAHGTIFAQNSRGKTPASFRSEFRYVIVHNRTDPSLGEGDQDRRVIEVLMDAKAFSEKNLKVLFSLVSKRFPQPVLLYINVSTSLEQLSTPEEEDGGTTSGGPDPPYVGKHYWAIYVRSDSDEFFRYSPLNDRTDIKQYRLEYRSSKTLGSIHNRRSFHFCDINAGETSFALCTCGRGGRGRIISF